MESQPIAVEPSGGSRRRDQRVSAGARVTLLTAALVAASIPLLAITDVKRTSGLEGKVPWWVFAIAFAVTELAVVKIEVRRECHGFTFSEVPLVVGLFFASPLGFVLARVIGAAVALGPKTRSPRKLAFNLGLFVNETVLALAVFATLQHSPDITKPSSWLAAVVAVFAADTLGMLCVTTVIRWHGDEPELGSTVLIAGATALANTSLALAAGLLLHETVAAVGLLLSLGVVLYCAYRGYVSLSRRYANLQLLYDFTRAIGGAERAESVLVAILEQARRVLRSDIAEIVLVGGDGTAECYRTRASGAEPIMSTVAAPDSPTHAVWASVVEHPEVVLVARASKRREEAVYLEAFGARDCIVAPLFAGGVAIGYLVVADRFGDLSLFDAQDARLLETLANHSSVAIENGRLVDRLSHEVHEREHQAAHDALTGLPNRATFIHDVTTSIDARHPGTHVAVMLMDLDRFKDVNDTLGHNVGDEVLCQVAARVSSVLGDGAAVARLGGDEFAILLPTVTDADRALEVARSIRSVLLPPLHVRDVALEIGASIGIAIAPVHGDDAHTLLRQADIAMYAAKREASGIEVYDEKSDEHTVQKLALVGALREAIDNDQLLVYYQPKVRICDEQVIGSEALVRWQHPDHGMLSPDVFVAIAERAGLIGGLTRLVARRAMTQCQEWRSQGFNLSVAVNLSVQSLLDAEFPDTIAGLLAETGLAPSSLTLEITESTIMDPSRTVVALERLAALGVKLSVDDFGTGYSSLTYLQRLPVHEVKVDRSFVMAMGTSESDAAIVKSIVDLGHNLGLSVVAEGVEDRVAWDRLARQGCDIVQGYYLSKPIPALAFTEWLRQWQPQRSEPVTTVERIESSIGSWR